MFAVCGVNIVETGLGRAFLSWKVFMRTILQCALNINENIDREHRTIFSEYFMNNSHRNFRFIHYKLEYSECCKKLSIAERKKLTRFAFFPIFAFDSNDLDEAHLRAIFAKTLWRIENVYLIPLKCHLAFLGRTFLKKTIIGRQKSFFSRALFCNLWWNWLFQVYSYNWGSYVCGFRAMEILSQKSLFRRYMRMERYRNYMKLIRSTRTEASSTLKSLDFAIFDGFSSLVSHTLHVFLFIDLFTLFGVASFTSLGVGRMMVMVNVI